MSGQVGTGGRLRRVVVGGGGSGLAAAIEARAAGRSVVLLEKNRKLGGSTAWSIGSISASGTPHQLAQRHPGSPRRSLARHGRLHWRPRPARQRTTCAACCPTRCPTPSAGCSRSVSASTARCRSRRTGSRACTTCCPIRASFITHLERRRAPRRRRHHLLDARSCASPAEDGRVVGDRLRDAAGHAPLPRARRRRAGERRFHQRSGTEGPVHGAAAGQDRRRQRHGDGRRPEAGACRSARASSTATWRSAPSCASCRRSAQPAARAAALARSRQPDGLVARTRAERAAASVRHELRHDGAGAVAQLCSPKARVLVNRRGERFRDELDAPASRCPISPTRSPTSCSTPASPRMFSAWPHFVSTAPGVAYAYVDDYRRNRAGRVHAGRRRWTNSRPGSPCRRGRSPRPCAQHNAGAATGRSSAAGPYVALGPVRAVFVHTEGGLAVDAEHRVLGAGDQADPRPLRGRLDRPGRPAAEGPRPSSGLGLRLGPPRRPQCRLRRDQP